MKKKIILGIAILLLVIQFVRPDYENPEIIEEKDFITITNPTESIKTSLVSACYDCHSNQTKYPWYSQVSPISWWTVNHVKHGRENLNFSEWGNLDSDEQKHKIEESIEEIQENRMPLKSYTWLHSSANLTGIEKKELIGFFKDLK